MGLLYIMPKSEKEANQISIKKNNYTITSYSLPYIFWIYFLIGMIVISAMSLPAIPIIKKLLLSSNYLDQVMGGITAATLISLPLTGLCFLFYKKAISIKNGSNIIYLKHRFFGFSLIQKTYSITKLDVEHFLSSPNVAKINKNEKTKSFENRGHFLLSATLENGKKVTLDRHTNKADLVGLENLILSKIVFNQD